VKERRVEKRYGGVRMHDGKINGHLVRIKGGERSRVAK